MSTFSCISFDSYIKPQQVVGAKSFLLSCISFDSYIKPQREHQTSFGGNCCISFDSYIKPQLATALRYRSISCISFDSYIKPQPLLKPSFSQVRCISFDSYIKPQLFLGGFLQQLVVYLLIPTSNHNLQMSLIISLTLYIFWFLHQTTTAQLADALAHSCISFDSYIKPQPWTCRVWRNKVVYLLIPTSNHNFAAPQLKLKQLYIFWFLHQTTTDTV